MRVSSVISRFIEILFGSQQPTHRDHRGERSRDLGDHEHRTVERRDPRESVRQTARERDRRICERGRRGEPIRGRDVEADRIGHRLDAEAPPAQGSSTAARRWRRIRDDCGGPAAARPWHVAEPRVQVDLYHLHPIRETSSSAGLVDLCRGAGERAEAAPRTACACAERARPPRRRASSRRRWTCATRPDPLKCAPETTSVTAREGAARGSGRRGAMAPMRMTPLAPPSSARARLPLVTWLQTNTMP